MPPTRIRTRMYPLITHILPPPSLPLKRYRHPFVRHYTSPTKPRVDVIALDTVGESSTDGNDNDNDDVAAVVRAALSLFDTRQFGVFHVAH